MQKTSMQSRTLAERLFHAITFEGLATLILAPTAAWIMQRSVLEMGGVAVLLATIAMIWNIIYNAIFDRLWPTSRVVRTAKVRVFHALGFEGGFIIMGVSVLAFALRITPVEAFMLEAGFLLFFLPYTIVYNWVYDAVRQRIVNRLAKRYPAY